MCYILKAVIDILSAWGGFGLWIMSWVSCARQSSHQWRHDLHFLAVRCNPSSAQTPRTANKAPAGQTTRRMRCLMDCDGQTRYSSSQRVGGIHVRDTARYHHWSVKSWNRPPTIVNGPRPCIRMR